MKKTRISMATVLVIGLLLSMNLCGFAQEAKNNVSDPEFRIKFGILSHRDNFFGYSGFIVGSDYLFYLENSSFGIAGGLEYISSAWTTNYLHRDWRDIVMTLSFLYFPTLTREIYLGMGLEYHHLIQEVTYLYTDRRDIRKDSGLGLHFVIGFNLGENIFLEGKINSVGISCANKGGISLQVGYKF